MKGIILSGGSATRLRPCTKVTSKQLLPVYNRPMIYYPLNTLIGENFIDEDSVCMILGDNIFEDDFSDDIKNFKSGAKIFAREVPDPERFGVVEFDKNFKAISIEEKPKQPKSNYCVTGLYVYDNQVVNIAKNLKPSVRGELEITDVNKVYLERKELDVAMVSGAWVDAGTFDSLLEAQILAKNKLQDKMII
jgi:glucose-1-phosphate thymidylyltransferase